MIEETLQRINFSGSVKVECKLSYENVKDISDTTIQYIDDELGLMKFSGKDLFSALENVRIYLEKNGFLLLCAGAMPNTYPSRMSRQMSNGRKAYIHAYGKTPDKSDIIDIFQPVSFEKVGTVEDQRAFISKWHKDFEDTH